MPWTVCLGDENCYVRLLSSFGKQRSLLKSVICGFNQLLDLQDLNAGIHSTRLAEWAIRVARKLGIPESDLYQIEVAALLHDIGKIGIPDAILKKEGKLSDEEGALMIPHVRTGRPRAVVCPAA